MVQKVRDPYRALGLAHNASNSEIKLAYRKLALRYHPDRQIGASPEEQKAATDKFAEISSAYALLSDESQKRTYDHIYKYGGFDNDSSDDDNHKPKPRSSSRPRNGSRVDLNDPIFFKRPGGTSARGNDPITSFIFRSGGNKDRVFATIGIPGTRGGRSYGFSFPTKPSAAPTGGPSSSSSSSSSSSAAAHVGAKDGAHNERTPGGNNNAAPWYDDLMESIQRKLSKCNSPCGPFLVQ